MNLSPNISCYFITFDNVPANVLDGDTFRVPGEESYEGILLKTLAALEYFLANGSYDFVIRTNISSIWDYPKLLDYLSTLPRTDLYCGGYGGAHGLTKWVSGAGIIMTPDVCKRLIDNRQIVLSFKVIDDVDIGYALKELGISIMPSVRHDVYDYTSDIPAGFYAYRVRLLPQPTDVIEKTINRMEFILSRMGYSRIRSVYEGKCRTPSDINEHLPVLLAYAKQCRTITECGVREPTSSYAFAAGLKDTPKNWFRMIDPYKSPLIEPFIASCLVEGVDASFVEASDLDCERIYTDLLFIDTWHVYGHLKRELAYWNGYVNKFIILHDTIVDEVDGETVRNKWDAEAQSIETGIPVDEITQGLGLAVHEFLASHSEWVVERNLTNNNGLMILTRRA